MAKQVVGLGTVANDGTGDTLRAGGDKINDNFNEVYTALGDGTTLDFSGAVAATPSVTANTAKVTNATHTGDVTGATELTIANDAVSNAKLANMATTTIKGRVTAGTGDPEDLTATQVRTLINVEDGADVTDAANVAAAGAAMLSGSTFTGTQDFNGQQVEGSVNKVVTSVTGTLTTVAHSGNILKTSGNVTVPTTAGFNCVLIAGGAHTVTFNGNTSAAMATGDIMTILVESGTVIHAVLTAAANKVGFS